MARRVFAQYRLGTVRHKEKARWTKAGALNPTGLIWLRGRATNYTVMAVVRNPRVIVPFFV
jgi:hypothetical protein